MTINSITNNYNEFNYNSDFTPNRLVFNTNIDNQRYVGIGTSIPEDFLTIRSDILTKTFYIKENFNFTTPTLHDNVSLLQINNKNNLIIPNLVSSINDNTGVEWSIVNNNNIKVTLRNYNDNVRLDYFSNYFIINNNLVTINLFSFNTITIRYIYIIKDNNELLNINDINIINDADITIETPDFSSKLLSSSNNLFKLSNYITLHGNKNYIIKIKNLSSGLFYNYKIQLFGIYDYYSGSLWNNENNTTYTMKNVGIGTNNPQANLHIIGNGYISGNVTTNDVLLSENIKTNTAFFQGNASISNILANTNLLIINPNKTPLGIGSVSNDDVFRINDFFKIKQNSTILSNNVYVTNNLNIIGNTSFINNNFSFSLQHNSVVYKYNNTSLINNTPNKINISKLHIIDSDKTYTNDDDFYVDGNITITGNLCLKNFLNIKYNPKNNYNINTLKSSNIIINNTLYNEGFTYSDNIDVNEVEFKKESFIPINNTNNTNSNLASLYFNKKQNKFMFFDTEKHNELATSVKLINKYEMTKLYTTNTSNITSIHSNFIETQILNNNKSIVFDNQAAFYFNLNSMSEEVIIYNTNKSYVFDIIY